MSRKIRSRNTSLTGLAKLKAYWKQDMLAGFMVFLIALPLSLGIAKASGFPPAMGVLTAIVGGIFTPIFRVSELSIKGPAAGLITICAASVMEFGGDEQAWMITCAAIVVMAILQIILSLLKFGDYADFFPHSAVHGMLSAIGIIIIAKQIPVLLGENPTAYAGEGPIELLLDIPRFISHANWPVAVVGFVGLLAMFLIPVIKLKLIQKIPAPMWVLLLTVPLSIYWQFGDMKGNYTLVQIGDFWGSFGFHFDFSAIATFAFWKYVFMLLFVNSLESMLTVKAVDDLQPETEKSDANGDLMGNGFGNIITGFLGATPMISEVVRSSANIGFKAKSKWANFFHGAFLLLAMIFLIPIIEKIPNAALAAILIYAGYRLAAPREFLLTYRVGKEQLAAFLVTIVVTLVQDLLIGILAGLIVELSIYLFMGVKLSNLVKANYQLVERDKELVVVLKGAALFTNIIGFKKVFYRIPEKSTFFLDCSEAKLIDHSFLFFIQVFQKDYNRKGGHFKLIGMQNHSRFSSHKLATRIKKEKEGSNE